ncbi:MAG: adenosylcobinamide-phosphate synthase CbiB [Porphyromonadaceae bacterium]|nr:adenosylcobinamide-phosphate synthase CbiB [Porphyromonadaceae bacterium]
MILFPFFDSFHFIIVLITGLALDTIWGDPPHMPHPVRTFGWLISTLEERLNKGKYRKVKGVFSALLLTCLVFGTLLMVEYWLDSQHSILQIVFDSLFFFFAISNRCLIDEALTVERQVNKGDIKAARQRLSRIVGRDTKSLSFNQIRCATLETLSENLSDGTIAPMFFYALGGIPLMMAYKMINTLDSMIGYKNERYGEFGWFAARILDDGANFIPSRLTALLMVLLPPSANGFRFVHRYGRSHASPNSGYPEAALAGILNCRFGGANIYGGRLVEKPYIGYNDRELHHTDIIKAIRINITTTVAMAIIIVVFGIIY